jgi:AraC-like DNA-binding protein
MSTARNAPGLVSFPALSTPLGRLNFGGILLRGSGTGFDTYRLYGMYAVVIITRGRGRYRDLNGYDCELRAGDLIVVFPEVAHQYGPPVGETWDEIFLAFEGLAFDAWRAEGLSPSQPVWQIGESSQWAHRIRCLLTREIATRSDSCTAAGELHALLSEWLSLREENAVPPWLDAARHSLADPMQNRSVATVAGEAGMSLDTFRRAFRAATGEPPARFQRRQRLAMGANLLRRRELTLKQIASMLGFCDEFHFSKAFKSQLGVSPSGFRERILRPGLETFSPKTHPTGTDESR